MKKIIILLVVLLQCACTNTFEKFYNSTSDTSLTEGTDVADTKLYFGNFADIKQEGRKMLGEGYVQIGYSSFYSSPVDTDEALEFGKKLNADIVIVFEKYMDTINSAIPITTPTFSTVNTSYHNNYGGYGYATSTIQGSETTYMPSTVDRYEYFASYWKKQTTKSRVGLYFEPLTNEIKQQINTNKGILVAIVVKDTPAFANDILVGDVITKINGKDVYDKASYDAIMDNIPKNSNVEYTIIRNGKTIKKKFKV